MLGGLWRLYRGCAVVVFTAELLLVGWLLWALVGAGQVTLPVVSSFVGLRPTPTATATPTRQPSQATATVPARFTLEITDAEVNAALAQQEDSVPGVKEVVVRFEDGKLRLVATLAEPVPAQVQATGTLAAAGGRLYLILADAQAGILPLPRAAVDLLESRANAALGELTASRKIHVESVEVLPGRARLTARTAS